MDDTMKGAAEAAEAEIVSPEETTTAPEEVQQETSEPQEDQVTTGTDEVTVEENTEQSEDTPATATEDFDPIVFLDSLEVENLTPEQKQSLKDGYLRQADYTKKTQAIAEQKKLIDEYSTLKPYIEKIFQDEDLYARVFGQPKQGAPVEESEYPEDPVEFAKVVQDRAVERAKAELREEMRAEQVEVAMENDRQAASQLDPRLNSDPEFAEEIGGILALDQEFLAGQKTAVQATQEALEKYKQRENKYRTKFTSDLQARAKTKRMVFPNNRGSNLGSVDNNQAPTSMAEAAAIAERDLS